MILEVTYCTPLGAQAHTEESTFSFPRGIIMVPEGKSTLTETVTNMAALDHLRKLKRVIEMWKRQHVKLN